MTSDHLVERIDVAGQWYGVTDNGRTLHVVIGAVRAGVRAVCGQAVDRAAVPMDGNRLCRRCDRPAPAVSTTS